MTSSLNNFRDRVSDALQSPGAAISAAFVLRMALLWVIHRDHDAHDFLFFPTSHEEWNIAWSLAHGNGFSSPLAGTHGPSAWVAPGYPWLIAAALRLTHNDTYAATVLCLSFNCLVSALTCWPIYGIARKFSDRGTALASCWLWVFLPTAVIYPLEWLWDPASAAFFLAAIAYFTLELIESSSIFLWAGYGAVWGIALLMNPAVGILLPFLFFWLIERRAHNHQPWLHYAGTAVFVCALSLAPWTARNYLKFGKIVPVKDNFGLELWLGNNPDVKTNWTPDHHPGSDRYEWQQLLQLGEVKYMQGKQRQADAFIEAHPIIFLRIVFSRVVDTWTGREDARFDRWLFALHARTACVWFTSVMSVLSLAGAFLLWRSFGWDAAPVWLGAALFPVTYYVSHVTLRYRHPVDPLLAILAVYALSRAFVYARPRLVGGSSSPVNVACPAAMTANRSGR